MATQTLRGSLLLAAPLLRDPNFARSVLYLAAHTAKEGAFGYILNRPLDKVVSELLPSASMSRLGQVPVYLGGPVSTDKLSFASLARSEKTHRLKLKTHLSVDDAAFEIDCGNEVRAFVGYSGWSEGQLEKELKHRSWIITEPDADIIAPDNSTEIWGEILTALGPQYELMSRMPERPELN